MIFEIPDLLLGFIGGIAATVAIMLGAYRLTHMEVKQEWNLVK